jgi:hypothetical protein
MAKKNLETFTCQSEVLETFEFHLPYMGLFSMNDGKPIDFINARIMRCIVCYNEVSLLNTQDAINVLLLISKQMALWP